MTDWGEHKTLPQPLRGCYEAGPTGFALYRAAIAASLELEVVAPSKTPRSVYARRLLVEAAWHYLPRPSVGRSLAERLCGQPDHVLQIALRAQRRLHRLYHRLRERGKPPNVTTVAVARELACFLWAAAVAD